MTIEGRSDFVLGVSTDLAALRKFIAAMEATPSSLKRVVDQIAKVNLGDGRQFAGDGEKLAKALQAGFRAELTGGNFNRALHAALRDLDFQIPAGAKAKFRADLQAIAREIRETLPQNVRVGVGVGKDLSRLPLDAQRAEARQRASADAEVRREAKARATAAAAAATAEAQQAKTRDRVETTRRVEEARTAGARARVADRVAGTAGTEAAKTAGTKARIEDRTAAQLTVESARTAAKIQVEGARTTAKLDVDSARIAGRVLVEQARTAEAARRAAIGVQAHAERQAITTAEGERRAAMRAERAEATRAANETQRRAALAAGLRDPDTDLAALERARVSGRQFTADRQKLFERIVPEQADRDRIMELVELDSISKRQATARRQSFLEDGSVRGKIRAGLTGFGGMGMTELATRITASSAIYNTASQGIFLVQQALAELAGGTFAFEEALGNLNVTMGDGKTSLRTFATDVGAAANRVGVTQAQGVEAAARSVGLFGTAGQSQADQQAFAKLVVEVTGRIARQSGTQDLLSVETPLAGTLRGFGLQNADITRVEDAAAVISKSSGGIAKDIIDAGAQVALLAKNAGFTLEQTSAIIANQSTATGETPQSAAELLSQVFAQSTNPAVLSRFQALGVNTQGTTLQQQIAEVSRLRAEGKLSDRALASLQAPFGRSRAGGAFAQLVTQQERIQKLAEKAGSSPGEGEKQFKEATKTVTFELTKMVGALRGLATELAQTGLFDVVALLIESVKLLAEGATEVLKVFNLLPREARSAAIGLAELAVVMKLLRGGSLLDQFGAAKLFAGRVAYQGQQSFLAARGKAIDLPGRHAAVPEGPGAIASLLTNPAVIAAVASVSAIVIASGLTDKAVAAQNAERKAARDGAGAVTVEDLRGAASSRREAAKSQEEFLKGAYGIGRLIDSVTGGSRAKRLEADNRAAADLDKRAQEIADAKARAISVGQGFGQFTSSDEITAQLDALTQAGYSAAQQVEILRTAFNRVADQATSTAAAVLEQGGQDRFGQGLGAALTKALADGMNQADLRSQQGAFTNPGLGKTLFGSGSLLAKALSPNADLRQAEAAKVAADRLSGVDQAKAQADVSRIVQQVLVSRGKDASKGDVALDQGDIDAVNKALETYGTDTFNSLLGDIQNLPEDVKKNFVNGLKLNVASALQGFKPTGLDAAQIAAALGPLFAKADEAFTEGSKVDRSAASAARVKLMKAEIAKSRSALQDQLRGLDPRAASALATDPNSDYSKALTQLSKFERLLDDATREDVKIQLERATAMRKLRTSRRGILDEAGRASDNIAQLKAELGAAVDPIDQLNAQAALNDAIAAEQQKNLDRATSRAKSRIDPRNSVALASAARADAQRRLAFARQNGDQKAIDDAVIALREARLAELQAQLGVSSARRLASVPAGDNVAAARAALANAKAELASTLKGTEAYYNGIAAVAQARRQVAEALLERQKTTDLLGIDLTDPVAQAQAEVRAAKRALLAARGPDERNQATLDLRNAQNQAEAAAFNQRLSDVQTADELGRISHEAYLGYLQSEHNRLSAISKRTRQQQDELDQIDKLMKSAADALNGQFNLGNITLPTIYQVRRAIQEGPGGIMAANNAFSGVAAGQFASVDNSQRTIVLQGVPIEEVMRRIYAEFGAPATAGTIAWRN